MIEAVLYDLDNCLFSTPDLPEEILLPVMEALRGSRQVSENQVALVLKDFMRIPLNELAARHGLPDDTRSRIAESLHTLKIDNLLHPFDDVAAIRKLPGYRFLVTTGHRRFQQRKIEALGLTDWFDEIRIDAIDEEPKTGKEAIFRDIMARYRLDADRVLVVGDNPASEIAAGNRIGCRTIQILRPGVQRAETADYYISTLDELGDVLARIRAGDQGLSGFLFVYGTLRTESGHPMRHFLKEASIYEGPAELQGRLYDLGEYPGAVPSGNPGDIVHGELYRLHPEADVLKRLDDYEGCISGRPDLSLFYRQKLEVKRRNSEPVFAWLYCYRGPLSESKLISSGDFRAM